MKISIQAISETIVKVICSADGRTENGSTLICAKTDGSGAKRCRITAEQAGERIVFSRNGGAFARQSACSLTPREVYRYTFTGAAPVIETEKTIDGERAFVKNADTVKVADAYEGRVSFALAPGEAIYGLGQQENGYYNYRDVKEYLYQNNMKIPMPVVLSSENYALLFDASCMFSYGEEGGVMTFDFDAVDALVYYVITGECFDELIAGIRALTGKAVLLPKWAYGYIQSRERYKTQEELLFAAEEFKRREIPVSCLVMDWRSWEEGKWGEKAFDRSRFPDPKGMMDQLHADGIAFMISVWPNPNRKTENNQEFAEKGKLLMDLVTYDAFDEEARDIYWKQCERELFASGTDAWWCDSTEPFTPDWNGETKREEAERYELAKNSTNRYLDARTSNLFALKHAQGIYEHQRAACKKKRVANLTRSGYIGSQRYGTILWSGDIAATWDVLRRQIAEGLSMAMSGIPYWTLDAGGFFTGSLECWKRFIEKPDAGGVQPWFWHGLFEKGAEDLGYRELYVRWLQLAAYLPVMRSHGTDTPREPWNFGEPGSVYYDAIVKYIKKRYAMLPYTYSLAWSVYKNDYTMLRSLMFDFAADEHVKELSGEFMYGPSYLVCPVTRPMEYGPESTPLDRDYRISVYLPKGADWYEEESGRRYRGGQTVETEAPVNTIPVFVRAGSVIPLASEAGKQADEIHIYAGADGSFELYEDAGNDYGYEDGAYSLIALNWEEKSHTLTARAVKTDCGCPESFRAVLHTDGKTEEKTLAYGGGKAALRF